MIHSRKLDSPCPKCQVLGKFGVLFLSNDQLVRGCSACEMTETISLPPLKKTVLYLDQFFLSAAFREKQQRFVDAMKRIRDLAMLQLLVCPWSDLHEAETHQWSHSQQQDLWAFVKKTAGGHRFTHSASIKSQQIAAGFVDFLNGEERADQLDLDDAFHGNIHGWDNHVWIDIRSRIGDADEFRRGKQDSAKGMASLFDVWRANPQSFTNDSREECRVYASMLEVEYLTYLKGFGSPDSRTLEGILGSWGAQVVSTLMLEQDHDLPVPSRFAKVKEFLSSDAFCRVPHVDASCRIMASLRKAIRRGELPTTERAEEAMFGFWQDMEMVSVFAPYTDAVFLDRTMHRWITDKECNLPERYGFKVFSVESWDAFTAFLDDVRNSKPRNHDLWLRAAYGS